MSLTGYTKSGADTAIATAVSAKADLVNGTVPTAQLPAIALFDKVTVADPTARKALTAAQIQPTDVAVQTNPAGLFMLIDADPSKDSSWLPLPLAGGVASVNGQTGAVTLAAADVGAEPAGAAAAAVSSANAYTDAKIANEVTRANAAYSKVTDNGNGTFTAT